MSRSDLQHQHKALCAARRWTYVSKYEAITPSRGEKGILFGHDSCPPLACCTLSMSPYIGGMVNASVPHCHYTIKALHWAQPGGRWMVDNINTPPFTLPQLLNSPDSL